MLKTPILVTVVTASLVLTACGDSDRRGHAGKGPHGEVIMPAASPSIHLKVGDDKGNTLNLMIECGADTALDECAEVNQDTIEKVSKIRTDARE